MRGINMCEPIGKWEKPVQEGITEYDTKEMKDTLQGRDSLLLQGAAQERAIIITVFFPENTCSR
jgi:hypothetical protein